MNRSGARSDRRGALAPRSRSGTPRCCPRSVAEAAREDVKVFCPARRRRAVRRVPDLPGHKLRQRWQSLPAPLRRAARWGGSLAVLHRQDDAEYMLKQFLAAAELPCWSRHLTWLGAMAIEDGVIAELAARLTLPSDDPLNRVMWFDF